MTRLDTLFPVCYSGILPYNIAVYTLFYISNSNGLLENVVERKFLKNNGVVISDFVEKYAFFCENWEWSTKFMQIKITKPDF